MVSLEMYCIITTPYKAIKEGDVGVVKKITATHVFIEYPQNFVYEGNGDKWTQKKSFPVWNSTPFAIKPTWTPYCSFVCIEKSKVEFIMT